MSGEEEKKVTQPKSSKNYHINAFIYTDFLTKTIDVQHNTGIKTK